ncbi:MAG: hypothetical protein WC623_24540 [Pedobacter sp.]|uniref:hypothetical protein n=1 Tax=Pedobacter sp. TaxID=1411316 RepID=UPI003568567F
MKDKDPRQNPAHKERGAKRFCYTYQNIATVLGYKNVVSVRRLVSKKLLNPESLGSIVEHWWRRKRKVIRSKTQL